MEVRGAIGPPEFLCVVESAADAASPRLRRHPCRARRRLLAAAERSSRRAGPSGLSVAVHAVPRGGPIAAWPRGPARQGLVARVAGGEDSEGKLSARLQAQAPDQRHAAAARARAGDTGTGRISEIGGGGAAPPPAKGSVQQNPSTEEANGGQDERAQEGPGERPE